MKNSLYLAAAFTLAACLLPPSSAGADQVVISEFMALNNTTLPDEDGQYSDWIEIYNAGNTAVNLDRWCLTDTPANLAKWRFPAINLPPFSFLIVFASGNNRTNAGSELHTNFRLDGDGEYLALVRPDGVTVVSEFAPGYPAQTSDVSYGLGMVPSPSTFMVPTGAVARYLVPTANIGTSWTGLGFNDAAWFSGATGIGYDRGTNYAPAIVTDIGAQMTNINSSAYFRLPFSIADPSQLQEMKLLMRYDDGFIAYLNGTEVVRANAPASATWNSSATGPHGSEPGVAARLRADFDTVTNAYTASQQGTAPGPAITAAGAGNTGRFLRLLNDGVNSQANSIAFHQTAPGLWPIITAKFDFRIADSAGDPADGFAFMLIPTSTYGTTGVGINPVGAVEEPNFAGVFSIGFDLYPHGTQNDVSAHWNGGEVVNVTIPRNTLELVSGTFHRLEATLEYIADGAQLTVEITPNVNGTPGAPYMVMDRLFIPNMSQFDCRVQLAGRTGGADMSVDLDNIDVQFGYLGGMVPIEEFELSSRVSLLNPGNNLLAIHGLNVSSTGPDFLIEPQLVARSLTVQTNNQIYLTEATPGAVNSGGAANVAPVAQFSIPGGVYSGSQTVTLSSPLPGAIIHYTINGGPPTEASPVYSGPITVTNSIALRTRVFADAHFPSEVKTEGYTILDPSMLTFSSPLPLVIVDGFNQTIRADMEPKATCNLTVIDVDAATGRARLDGRINFHGRAGVEGRGQTSWGFNKKPMNIELWDENDQDERAPLLDMPAGADWALISLWNDKTFLNDFLGFTLFEQMGNYSVRRRFVEVFWNGPYPGSVSGQAPTGGTVGNNDYVGIYLLVEKIEINENRLDITELDPADTTEPDITGGYIWKLDKPSPGDWPFATPQVPYDAGASLRFHDPRGEELSPAQRDWLTNYLVEAENVLYGSNWRDPREGYAKYYDVDSFVDQHWIVEFSKQIDGYRLSSYFHQDRGGKITWVPIWDWNLSFGNANYLEGGLTQGWYYPLIASSQHIWERRMIGDPEYNQRLVDRWGELRNTVLSLQNVLGLVDTYTNLLNEPKDRDFSRFPRLGQYLWPNPNGPAGGWNVDYQNPTTYAAIIEQMKKWINGRYAWIDSLYLKAPIFSRYGGSQAAPLSMFAPIGTVYYTTDGSDPRLVGGVVSSRAQMYGGPISLPPNARVFARVWHTNAWSPPAKAVFGDPTPSLAVSELMYHPAGPPPGTLTNAADDFEYIEFVNTGSSAIDLTGMRLADGVDFTFPSGALTPVGTPTTNDFDSTGTSYSPQTLGSGTGSTVRIGGPSGSYLRLITQDTGTNRNRITFDQTASGPYDHLVAEFDFRANNLSAPLAFDTPTVQGFDSPGSTYRLRNFDTAGDANTPIIMTDGSGPTGNYVRMTRQVGNESGGIYFDATESSANTLVLINFDFRCQGSADGFGMVFLNTANYGVTGTNSVPAFSEEPNVTGSIGIGFDIYNNANPPTDYNANHVSLHWNGSMVSTPPANPSLGLASGQFHRAEVTIKFETGRALVTVKVTPDVHGSGGVPETLFDNFVINGASAYRGRLAFCGRTGGAWANQDIDNVSVQYLAGDLPAPGGLSMQLLPVSTFGATGPGSTLGDFTDVPAAPGLFALNLDLHIADFVNNVNVYWNGSQAANAFIAPGTLNLDDGVFHRARLELTRTAEGSLATVRVTPNILGTPGQPVTVFSNVLIQGYSPEDARVEFAGRSGGQNVNVDLENVNVRFEQSPNSLAPGERILVVKNRAAFESRYGTGLPVAGEYTGQLDNAGERLLLVGAYGDPILEFTYNDEWYPITDGNGFSLVMSNPTLPGSAWNDPLNWRASAQVGGSPGVIDPAPPTIAPVVINEALAHSDDTLIPGIQDYIELRNLGTTSVDVGNWYLSDSFDNPRKYRIPAPTVIPAGGYWVVLESSFNSNPGLQTSFALGAEGDDVFVFSGDAAMNLTGWYHGYSFGASDPNVSLGRVLKSTGEEDFVAQTNTTPGAVNQGPLVGPVVVTEVMYHPPDYPGSVDNQDDEFVELRNIVATNVVLFDPAHSQNTWRLRDAVDFDFPLNTTLALGAYALVVSFDPVNEPARLSAFRTKYGLTGSELIFGPYNGKLDNSNDSVELVKPSPPDPNTGNVEDILVDKVHYTDNPPWPLAADGMGHSLHRLTGSQYGDDPINWTAAISTPGAGFTPGLPPTITMQPISQTNSVGGSAAFSVSAAGLGTLGYQWRFNGNNILGATNETYSLSSLTLDQAGAYQVVVLNEQGAAESDVVYLSVVSTATILTQPARVALAGSTNLIDYGNTTNGVATFNVVAFGNGPLTYQWRFNGAPVAGATSDTLEIVNVNLSHQGIYDVVVSDPLGSVVSDPARLDLLMKPVIVVAPLNQVVPVGGYFSASVSVRGSPPPFMYQWRRGSTIIAVDFSDSTNSVFTYGPVTTSDNSASWRIALTNAASPVITTVTKTFAVTVQADFDRDLLPDPWEVANGFSTNDPGNASADLDGDGMTLLEEYTVGTDWTDPASYLRIDHISAPGAALIEFRAVSNRTYSVQYQDDGLTSEWSKLFDVFAVNTNRTIQVMDPAPANAPQRVYRLVVPAQP